MVGTGRRGLTATFRERCGGVYDGLPAYRALSDRAFPASSAAASSGVGAVPPR